MAKICSVDECKEKHRAKGFCAKHYAKWIRYGNPLHIANLKETGKKISEANRGKKRSEITKRKMSESGKGRKHSEASKKKMSESHIGVKLSVEHKKKLSEAGKWRKHSKETRKKLSESNKGKNKGKKPSESVKEKIRKANTGKKHTEEAKMKQSEAHKGKKNPMYGKTSPNKGKKTSQEIKEKIRKTLTGFKHTEETKKKMSGKIRSKEYVEKMRKIANNPERKALQKEIFKRSRKNMARPNIPEKAIGKILEEIGIKFKFLQDIDYKTLENKPSSKEMDIVWKDSMGNKKIIEYNGYRHYDNRNFKPDDVVIHHNKSTKCQDIWNEENTILNQIRKEGHKILVIWALDFQKDLERTTKQILKFAKS